MTLSWPHCSSAFSVFLELPSWFPFLRMAWNVLPAGLLAFLSLFSSPHHLSGPLRSPAPCNLTCLSVTFTPASFPLHSSLPNVTWVSPTNNVSLLRAGAVSPRLYFQCLKQQPTQSESSYLTSMPHTYCHTWSHECKYDDWGNVQSDKSREPRAQVLGHIKI